MRILINFAPIMYSDNLTYNQNYLPPEKSSLFKKLIQVQDEVCIGNKTYFMGNIKDKFVGTPIVQKSFVNDKAYCTSVFDNTKMRNKDFSIKPIAQKHLDWIFFTLLFCLLTLVIINFTNRKRVASLVKSFMVPHFTNQLIREGSIQKEFFTYPMLLIYFISFGLLCFKILIHFFNLEPNLLTGLKIFGFVAGFYISKYLFASIFGLIFRTKKETFEYTTNTFIFSIVTGMFLVPMVFLVYYFSASLSSVFFYIALIITMLIFVYRSFRGFLIGLSSERYHLYYLFLYLCSVEILPILISVKLLTMCFMSKI